LSSFPELQSYLGRVLNSIDSYINGLKMA